MSAPTLPAELQRYRLLKDTEAAAILGIAPQTLRNARFNKKGPLAALPYRKFGTAVRYSLAEILNFSDASKVEAAG
jgi:hypothetical protein